MGYSAGKILPILEINPKHELFEKLSQNEAMIYDAAEILLDMAKLNEGVAIDDPSAFSKKLIKILLKAI